MAHQHPVKDTDLHFVIDPVTRVVKNNSGKIVIMQHDHQSEILTFELPRYIDTHDMSLSNTVRVHYINIGTSSKYTPVSGVYEVNDLQVDATNENLVTCSWTLTNNATQLEGTLNFIIRFSCLTGDTIDYSWSTAIYSGIIVAKTIDSSDYVMTAIPDILEQWKASLKGDPFTYEDFTPEQLEGLRGPAGIIISETEPTNENHPVWIRPSGEYIVENLGLTGATVGQTVKIKAIDENGVPTEWEAADMASGGDGWTEIGELTVEGTKFIISDYTDGVITVKPDNGIYPSIGRNYVIRKPDYSAYINARLVATETEGKFTLVNLDNAVYTPSADLTQYVIDAPGADALSFSNIPEFSFFKAIITTPLLSANGSRSTIMSSYRPFNLTNSKSAGLAGGAAELVLETEGSPIAGKIYTKGSFKGSSVNRANGYDIIQILDQPAAPANMNFFHYNGLVTIGTKVKLWGRN